MARSLFAGALVAPLAIVLVASVVGCGTADTRLDPGDLEVRDLLGVDPDVAARWDGEQRASARRVLETAFAEPAPSVAPVERVTPLGLGADRGEAVAASLTALDEQLGDGPPWLLIDVTVEADQARAVRRYHPLRLDGVDSAGVLAALEARLTPGETVKLQRAARAPFAAAHVAGAGLLLINPVILAALEPTAAEHPVVLEEQVPNARPIVTTPPPLPDPHSATPTPEIGNPYAFYGSLGECAAAERVRCESCLPVGTCKPQTRDSTDGNTECTTLAADDGRGYYLLCANLALAIDTVAKCVTLNAASCSEVTTAGNQIGALDDNQTFLDSPCRDALDACLTTLYGAPSQTFPTPGSDAGPQSTPPVPRSTDVNCGKCDNNFNCNFSPQCGGCSGGNCTSPSCQSGSCSSGGCSKSSTSSGSGCDTSCGSGSGSGSSGCNSGCGSQSSSGSSGCGSGCGSSSSSSSSGCSNGGCGSSSSGSSSSSCSNSKCDVAPSAPAPRELGLVVMLGWAFLPLLILMRWRRKAAAVRA